MTTFKPFQLNSTIKDAFPSSKNPDLSSTSNTRYTCDTISPLTSMTQDPKPWYHAIKALADVLPADQTISPRMLDKAAVDRAQPLRSFIPHPDIDTEDYGTMVVGMTNRSGHQRSRPPALNLLLKTKKQSFSGQRLARRKQRLKLWVLMLTSLRIMI